MNQPMQILTSHESEYWNTPVGYINLVRKVFLNAIGTVKIDLDPASNQLAQSYIQANRWFDGITIDGLAVDWNATTVFCNPPYGKFTGSNVSKQARWSEKMIQQFERGNFQHGILLVNSTHGYKWYEDLWTRYSCCLLRDRISFWNAEGYEIGKAKRGQTFVLFSKSYDMQLAFERVFAPFGRVLLMDLHECF